MKKKNFLGIIAMIVIVAMVGFAFVACGSPSNDPDPDPDPDPNGPPAPTVVNIAAIGGVTVPASGGVPATTIAEHAQVTGTITWADEDGEALEGNFDIETVYVATITLTAKTGFTLTGVDNNFFNVADADEVTSVGGVVTATFPKTEGPTKVDIYAIGVTRPVWGEPKATTIYAHDQVYGTITWADYYGEPAGTYSTEETVYVATITLKARTGNTLVGVGEDFFEVDGADYVSSTEVENYEITVTAQFPATYGPTRVDIPEIGVTAPVKGEAPATTIAEHDQVYGTIEWECDDVSEPAGSYFTENTVYVAIITLTARTGYTLTGVPVGFFEVDGTDFANSLAVNDAGEIRIVAQFPRTERAPLSMTWGDFVTLNGFEEEDFDWLDTVITEGPFEPEGPFMLNTYRPGASNPQLNWEEVGDQLVLVRNGGIPEDGLQIRITGSNSLNFDRDISDYTITVSGTPGEVLPGGPDAYRRGVVLIGMPSGDWHNLTPITANSPFTMNNAANFADGDTDVIFGTGPYAINTTIRIASITITRVIRPATQTIFCMARDVAPDSAGPFVDRNGLRRTTGPGVHGHVVTWIPNPSGEGLSLQVTGRTRRDMMVDLVDSYIGFQTGDILIIEGLVTEGRPFPGGWNQILHGLSPGVNAVFNPNISITPGTGAFAGRLTITGTLGAPAAGQLRGIRIQCNGVGGGGNAIPPEATAIRFDVIQVERPAPGSP